MIVNWFVNIILFSFCIVDIKFYKIKNDMIIFSLLAYLILISISYSTNQKYFMITFMPLVIFIISQVVLLLLSLVIPMSYGDVKLIGVILVLLGMNDGLYTIFFGSCFSLFLLQKKIVKKVPMGLMFYLGYLIHSLLKEIMIWKI